MKYSKILVTGGLGFIGSHFVRRILRLENVEITNLDKNTYAGNPENLADVENDPRYRCVEGNIADVKTVERAMSGCDAVVNFAAETHVDNSIASDNAFVKTNVFGTHVLLKCALNDGVKKFVQISTDEVYGSVSNGFSTEESLLNPSNPYSASKAAAEQFCFAYHATFGLPVAITRSSNNFGPNQHPEKLIPKVILNALGNKPIPVYGTGKNVRDWIYVEENCRAIELVLEKGAPGQVYNVAGNNEKNNLEIVRKILEMTGKSESLIKFVEDRKGHDFRYALDGAKLRRLGFEADKDFKTQLGKTVEWYEKNRAWCEKCKTF